MSLVVLLCSLLFFYIPMKKREMLYIAYCAPTLVSLCAPTSFSLYATSDCFLYTAASGI